MSERIILEALQNATKLAVASTTIPTLPIKFLGRTLIVPNDQRWLEIVHIPNNRSSDYWDENRIYQGIFRLVLHWNNNDTGIYNPLDIVQALVDYFSKEKNFGKVKIYDHPSLISVEEAGKELLFPLSIPYRYFALAQ